MLFLFITCSSFLGFFRPGLFKGFLGVLYTQRAQYPLIKEYTLNHNIKPLIV